MNNKGINLLETLVAGAIFAGVVISGVTLSGRVSENSIRGSAIKTMSANARAALTVIRDDLQLASIAGTLNTAVDPVALRVDPNRGSGFVIGFVPEPTPESEVTYFLDEGVLYRVDADRVTDLARNVTRVTTVVEDIQRADPTVEPARLVHVTLTFEMDGFTQDFMTTARLRSE